MVSRNNTCGVGGNIAFSQYSFLQPGQIRDPGDVPAGWVFEYRAGVDEYQRMSKGELLRIRKSSARTATEVFWTYRGAKYLGAPTSLAEAVSLAMGTKYAVRQKAHENLLSASPGMDME